ncbi:MAG: anhydro-N-acetylmuramic acid kinase [Elainellaceae cyanobacterium]
MYVVGLMSGTSVDGIDAALVELSGLAEQPSVHLLAGQTYPYEPALRDTILAVCGGEALPLAAIAELDDAIAYAFAQAARDIQAGRPPAQLVGSHGQTVYHRPLQPLAPNAVARSQTPPPSGAGRALLPDGPSPQPQGDGLAYSLQLGRGDEIARLTDLPTVVNFRRADIALGGEGAPLVPAVDAVLLRHPSLWRCVQNIGGISNLAYLPPSSSAEPIRGWDTGPGNALLDLAVQALSAGQQTYDENGGWAATGAVCEPLLARWLDHPFFSQPPPKSTGRELFGADFLQQCLAGAQPYGLSAADLLATLSDLTAASIALSYEHLPRRPDEILLCGGGQNNQHLVSRIQHYIGTVPVVTTDVAGLSPDYKEAIAFALLGYWRWYGIPSNLPSATGASRAVPLGELYLPPQWTYDRVEAFVPPVLTK